ncbi:hypothetical protein Mc24_03278 [Thermotoga sp. Mc24]|uniref:hypothetical protein n=1 Tax=Thermotoga TaxID=2335 RepID=UPI0000EB8918|nr:MULTISPECIES: hypothetical protein [Thermotoga]KHC92412.1 hypothetical protein Mc24_03278 [Thermotoga sp. Mc24]
MFSGLFDLLSSAVFCNSGGIIDGTQETDTLSETARGLVDQLQAVISNTSSFEIPNPDGSPIEYKNWAMRFLEGASSMIYILSDFEQLVEAEGWQYLYYVFQASFSTPAPVTSIEVEGTTEYTTKFIPFLLNNKPDFVKDTYFLSLKFTTEDGTTTAVQWPMILVNGKCYFFSLEIVHTNEGTEVRLYPKPQPIL